MATGEIVTLYENKDRTIAAYPRTVSEAVKHVEDDGTVRSVSEVINDLKNSVSDGKELLATAITNKKVATEPTDSFATMASNIDSLRLGSGNATTADVLSGKTFTNSDGIEYTGTMPNRGTSQAYTAIGGYDSTRFFVRIPNGYYRIEDEGTNPYIRINYSEFGNASASDVISGKTFTSSEGLKKSGTYTPSFTVDTLVATSGAGGVRTWSDTISNANQYALIFVSAFSDINAGCTITSTNATQIAHNQVGTYNTQYDYSHGASAVFVPTGTSCVISGSYSSSSGYMRRIVYGIKLT